jgi:hypothetical protein
MLLQADLRAVRLGVVGSNFLLFTYSTAYSLYTFVASYLSLEQIGLGSLLAMLIVECIPYRGSRQGTFVVLYPTSR